jgi:hypothetical protein
VLADASMISKIIESLGLFFLYGWTVWRVGKRSAGSKLMESACIAGGLFMGMVAAMKIPGCPDWVAASIGLLGLLVGFAMIFFIFKGAFFAIRNKLHSHRAGTR